MISFLKQEVQLYKNQQCSYYTLGGKPQSGIANPGREGWGVREEAGVAVFHLFTGLCQQLLFHSPYY